MKKLLGLMLVAAGCASSSAPLPEPITPPGEDARRETAPMPPVPAVDGPLRLDVAYPAENAAIAVRDSTFIFGSTGSGRATLTINGAPVTVAPNGAWLAFLPVPADGVYRLQATRDGETATLERRIRVPAPPDAATTGARIVSVSPTGPLAVRPGENITVSFTGTPGGQAFLVLPAQQQRIPLLETRAALATANNAADFQVNAPTTRAVVARYSGVFQATGLRSRDTAVALPQIGELPPMPVVDTVGVAHFELIVGSDTVRAPLPANISTLSMARVGMAFDRQGRGAQRDWRIRGRNAPAGPFHYFWPHGTLLTITGQRGGFYRVQLAGDLHAWVPVADVELLQNGTVPPGGYVTGTRFNPLTNYIDLRIAVPGPLPYHVEVTEFGLQIDVFGATSQVNFFQYGRLDPLIARAGWSQPRDSVYRVNVELTQPVWGFDAFHDGSGAVVLRIRRPPNINPDRPLQGLVVAVDPGHGGQDTLTIGPTRLPEAHANLAIALAIEPLLQAAGAHVVMTRRTNVFLDLAERTRMAADSNAHILLSVHNNAFPDGVNPFLNNGTSTYYYHPMSVDLAQFLQGHLLAELGLRDIGFGRADLALVRPTWMPSALTETSFMMVPEQEAALRNPAWIARIAQAHVRALEDFLRRRAGMTRR